MLWIQGVPAVGSLCNANAPSCVTHESEKQGEKNLIWWLWGTLSWSDTYSAFSFGEQSRRRPYHWIICGVAEGKGGGVSGRKDRFNSSTSHYTSVAFLRPLFLGAGLLLVLDSALPVVFGSAVRLYLGLVDEVSSEMGVFSVGLSAWGRISESSCSWQQSWPARGCVRSAPSWWALQKELGHSWQKASEFFPQTSQWCQGQSQRPARQQEFQLHSNTMSSQKNVMVHWRYIQVDIFYFTSKNIYFYFYCLEICDRDNKLQLLPKGLLVRSRQERW